MIHSNCQSRNRFSLFAVTLVALTALSPAGVYYLCVALTGNS
jgi:hypothetical protein